MRVFTIKERGFNRRQFLRKAAGVSAAAVGFPYVVASSALGKAGSVAPSNRITMGFIGTGKQSKHLMRSFLNSPGTHVLAACDVDELKLERGQKIVEDHYAKKGGGGMTDWGAHHFDIAQWGLGMDESGPVEIIPPDGKDYKVLTYKYADGVTMTRDRANGVLFTGTKGKVEVDRGHLRTWPDNLKNQQIGPNEIHLYECKNHYTDWLDTVRNRTKPICDIETGCRSVTVCHLGNIAYTLGSASGGLKWDPKREVFVGDSEANRLLSRAMRSPWHL